jgi:hypothetical protein
MGTYQYDYIVTGSVQQQGTSYVVNLQIQNACNRNTIASVSIPFQATSEYKSIGEQAANRLSPLIGKINEYEFNEREENMDNKLDKGDNEKIYPSDATDMVKKRLTQYLQLSATVDFDAVVKDRRFVNPEYEKKSSDWKMCFRAGKEVNEAAREFAKEWLKEL